MFAIINVSQTNAVFRKPEISSQRVALQNAETFFLVTTEKSYGRVPWKKLENCMGILKKDVILTGDTVLPEYSGISEFIPDVFPYIVLINTAIDRLKNGRHKSLIIFDEKAICMDYIQSFVNSFERIRVITSYAEKYTSVARILLEKGVDNVCISAGSRGVYYQDREEGFWVTPKPLEDVANATGAGDSLMGALLAGFTAGMPLKKRVQFLQR